MSDPFEILRSHEGHANGLPAAEVRRRGDRLRTRRTTLQAVAATLAVGVVVGGVALGSGVTDTTSPDLPPSSQDPSPDASPSPVRAQVTSVPADLPLALGYPVDKFSDMELVGPGEGVAAFDDVRACGRRYATVADETDRLAVRFEQPEDFRARKLTLHGSDAAAQANLTRFVDLFRGCPREEWDDRNSSNATVTEVQRSGVGDEGWTIVRRAELFGTPSPGLQVIEAVRVGNAVLLTTESGEGGAGPDAGEASVRFSQQQLAPLVDAMCVFSDAGCLPATTAAGTGTLSIDDLRTVTSGFRTDWQQVGADEGFAVECPGAELRAVSYDSVTSSRFEGTGSTDVNARATSAVLGFATRAASRAAHESLRTWISSCDDSPAGGATADAELAAKQGATRHGPYYWRLTTSPAPEVYVECGTAWLHARGVAQVGDQVALLSIEWIGDLEVIVGAEAPRPDEAIRRAAEVAAETS